jgi:hypothetical protein
VGSVGQRSAGSNPPCRNANPLSRGKTGIEPDHVISHVDWTLKIGTMVGMFANWKPKLVVIISFIGGLLNYLVFFGIDAKTIRDQITTHYLFLIAALAFTVIFMSGIYWWWRSSRVTTKNIEQKVKQWIDAFGLTRRIVTNEKLHFGIQVSIPPRFIVTIGRPKDRPSYLTLVSSFRLSKQQRVLFDK